MENSIEIKVINGFWSINKKPLFLCGIKTKNFFAIYVKTKTKKKSTVKKSSFKKNPAETKRKFNYRFHFKFREFTSDFLNDEPNIEKLIFEPKN